MSSDSYFIKLHNCIHYLTFTVVDWIAIFTRIDYKQSIVQSLNYGIHHKGLEVYSRVLMSNHMHVVAKAKSNYRLSFIIRQNPVRQMIVADAADYIFSSTLDYVGKKGLVDVVIL